MNIEWLKLGFFQYLQEKLAEENSGEEVSTLDLASMNILPCADENGENVENIDEIYMLLPVRMKD